MPTQTRYHISPFCPAHLEALPVEALVESGQWDMSPITPETLVAYQVEARTLWNSHGPIACGGVALPWPTLGFAWLLCTPGCHDHKPTVARNLLRMWRQVLSTTSAKRIESLVLRDFTLGRRMVTLLGFRVCCLKPWYGPQGETFVEYVWERDV